MDDMADLGEFLRSRRAAIQPEDVGLTRYNERRRVTGLRREELAQLAGLSATYYTRLEQGHGAHPSESVVESLAQALRLGPDEAAHLRALASPRRPSRRRARQLYAAWTRMLRDVVGYLRYATGQYADDQDLFELIGELCATSAAFATA